MSPIRQFLVFLTGHRLASSLPDEEIGSLTKIGSAIAFATLLASIQFGIAGWFLANNLPITLKILMTCLCAMIGALIVLVLDRNFIYLADTRYESSNQISRLYLGIRIFLIMVIGSLSSQFTMPLLLKSELAIHAQDLKDSRLVEAKERYQSKYDLREKSQEAENLEQKKSRLNKEIQAIPADILRLKHGSEQCYRDYRQKLKSTYAPDLDETEILNLYAKDKKECDRLDVQQKEAYKNYLLPREGELRKTSEELTKAQGNIEVAKNDIAKDLAKASSNDEAYINITSSDVLWSLIKSNPGAFMKYVLLTLLQLCLELMPILLKIQAGQSEVGHRIALNAFEFKTRALAERDKSARKRVESLSELSFAEHQSIMLEKKQLVDQQNFETESSITRYEQQIKQEKLKQELEELKHKSSSFSKLHERFNSNFAQTKEASNPQDIDTAAVAKSNKKDQSSPSKNEAPHMDGGVIFPFEGSVA